MEKFLEHQIGFDEYITGNRFIDICEESGATFCKTDYLPSFRDEEIKLFVTHNSDFHIDENMIAKWSPKTTCWLAQNKDYDTPELHGIPIGLENMVRRKTKTAQYGTYSSEVPGALQKAQLIDRINSLNIPKNGDVYMNFNISTCPNERQAVWNKFANESWVTSTQGLPMSQFYFDLAAHKFAISPRGNGVDCHRTWESLYLRTIPIVKTSIHMNEFLDLPILFVKDWSELNYNRMLEFYEKVQNEFFNLDKMKISYWRQRILNAKNTCLING